MIDTWTFKGLDFSFREILEYTYIGLFNSSISLLYFVPYDIMYKHTLLKDIFRSKLINVLLEYQSDVK